jgi:hypothetical protein
VNSSLQVVNYNNFVYKRREEEEKKKKKKKQKKKRKEKNSSLFIDSVLRGRKDFYQWSNTHSFFFCLDGRTNCYSENWYFYSLYFLFSLLPYTITLYGNAYYIWIFHSIFIKSFDMQGKIVKLFTCLNFCRYAFKKLKRA